MPFESFQVRVCSNYSTSIIMLDILLIDKGTGTFVVLGNYNNYYTRGGCLVRLPIILVILKKAGACEEFQILAFSNSLFSKLGNFQINCFSNYSTYSMFCSWACPNYSNYSQRDGSLLRNSRFIF